MKENYSEEILDSLIEGIITIDKEFKITFINSAAERITGLKKNEIFGKLCKTIFCNDLCKTACPIRRILESGKSISNFKNKIKINDNEEIEVKINATVLRDEHSKPIGGVISFADVSREKNVDKILFEKTDFHGIVGNSSQMKEIYTLINEISDSDAPVLIQGETGTGKELIANAVQVTSKRRKNPFLKINCAVFPPDLLASELFGHVKGSFTGANMDRTGRFELANSGTIFLDEISEMSLQMQTHLLRILQDGTFERVGDSITRNTDVRIITATNIDVEKAMEDKAFREDLYFRINVIPINLPPLRNRREDIPVLTNHFIKKFSLIYDKPIDGIDDDALQLLMNYNWPGNIRQLENVIEYAFARSHQDIHICICSLPVYLRKNTICNNDGHPLQHHAHISLENLLKVLDANGWNKSLVADELGVNRTTVWRKIKEFGLEPK